LSKAAVMHDSTGVTVAEIVRPRMPVAPDPGRYQDPEPPAYDVSDGSVTHPQPTSVTNAFSSAQLLQANYTDPPNWQTLVYTLATNPVWAGKIVTKMRFDPASVANADFDIDWIRASDGSLNDRLNFGLVSPASSTNLPMRFYGGAGLTYQLESATDLTATP
jgi:hypothetical protein